MRTHLVLRISKNIADTLPSDIPSWQNFILDKSHEYTHFTPEVDAVFRKFSIPFWVTYEYESKYKRSWTKDEIESGFDRIFRIILQDSSHYSNEVLRQLERIHYVEEVRAMAVGKSEIPAYALQESLDTTYPGEHIYLKYAHMLTRGSKSVRIAILDTGVDTDHSELEGKIIDQYDCVEFKGFDTSQFVGDVFDTDKIAEDEVGHGSHIAGIIAGKGLKINEGVAPDCSLLAVRVLASMKSNGTLIGAGLLDNINSGIKWAVDNGADVINMSLGVRHEGGGLPHQELIEYALKKEVTIVAASGNDGTSQKYYPSALKGVIAVGATDENKSIAGFTSYGAEITVAAPGSNIYSSYSKGQYAFSSGTSQAAPFVSGYVALMKSYAREKGKTLTNELISYILRNTSDRPNNLWRNRKTGYGLINMADGFKLLNRVI